MVWTMMIFLLFGIVLWSKFETVLFPLSPSLPPSLPFSFSSIILCISLLSFYPLCVVRTTHPFNSNYSYPISVLILLPSSCFLFFLFILSFWQLPQNLNMLTDIIHSCWGACILPDPGPTDLESEQGIESGTKTNL